MLLNIGLSDCSLCNSMPNIPYYTNPVFTQPEDNNNVTLIRAQRNGMWDYDKTERRHKSTNVLTYRVRDTVIDFTCILIIASRFRRISRIYRRQFFHGAR